MDESEHRGETERARKKKNKDEGGRRSRAPKTSKLALGTPLMSTRTMTSSAVSSHACDGVMKPIARGAPPRAGDSASNRRERSVVVR